MDEAVSAAAGNRNFSRILRHVRDSHCYVVTSDGLPVARLIAVNQPGEAPSAARDIRLSQLAQQLLARIGHCTRDELYADEE